MEYEGLPPLKPSKRTDGRIAFLNVRNVLGRAGSEIVDMMSASADGGATAHESIGGEVIVENGKITCSGPSLGSCLDVHSAHASFDEIVDLAGGSISPAMITFGTSLGLSEIKLEPVTNDGPVYDPFLAGGVPRVLKDRLVGAVDGLQFGGRNTLYVHLPFPSLTIMADRG